MRNRESGKGSVGLIIFLLVIGIGIFFLVQYIPPRISAYEFRDEMNKINTDPDYKMRRLTEEHVVDILVRKAVELKLPIDKKQIRVEKRADNFIIQVSFQIPIDLKVTTMVQKYDFTEPRGY